MLPFKLAVLTLFCTCLVGIILTVKAAEYNVGVAVGQWVKYENILATGPNALPELNETRWIQIDVVEISGKNVTLHVCGEFKNGASIPQRGIKCNVETGWTNASLLNAPLISLVTAAGLQAGDVLPGTIPLKINKTETRDYEGLITRVNILNLTMADDSGNRYNFIFGWDKPSGMLLELTVEIRTLQPQTYSKMAFSMTTTNIPEFSSNIILSLFMVVVLVAVLSLKKKFSRKTKT